MSINIVARVPEKVSSDIDFFAREEQVDKSTEIRLLLARAIQEKMINYALLKYKNQEVTLWKAAKIARIPLSKLMIIAAQQKIPIQYYQEDLKDDFTAVFGKRGR